MDNNSNQPTTSNSGNNRLFSVLAYIWILWIVGLIASPNEPDVRFHVNQGLVLFLFEIAASIAATILIFIPILGWLLAFALGVAGFVFMILGIVNAANGHQKELPIIGKIHLLK